VEIRAVEEKIGAQAKSEKATGECFLKKNFQRLLWVC